MALPTDDIVTVTSTLETVAAATNSFQTLAVVGSSTTLPLGARQQTFTTLAGVAAMFDATSEEYKASSIFFSQSPAGDAVTICRRLAVPAAGELLGGQEPVTLLSTYTAIAAGGLNLEIDGIEVSMTGINLSGAQTLDAVAYIVGQKIAATKAGAACTWNGTQFIILSGTTGTESAVTYAGTAASGTDLAPLMALRPADGAVQSPGAVAETITQSLVALNQGTALPYMVQLTTEATVQNLLDAAAWCLANKRVFAYTDLEPAALNTGDQTSVGYQLKQLDNGYAFGQFAASTDPYAITSIASRMLSVDLSQPNSASIAKFKQEPGVNTVAITEAQRLALEAVNLNYYTLFGVRPVFAEGTMADGTWFDTRQALDYIDAGVQETIFDWLASQSTLTPYSDAGMASLAQQLELFLDQVVAAGVLAPNTWNGAALGRASTGSVLPGGKGYYVYWPSVSTRTQAQRNSRIGPPVSVLLTGSGAIQGLSVNLTYQQ